MPDRRAVDDLSIEELEQVLAIKKRQAREATRRRLEGEGRVVGAEMTGTAAPRPASGGPAPPAGPRPSRFRALEIDSGASRRIRLTINWRRLRDRFLLLVEVSALVGLVLVVVGVEQARQELNRDVAAASEALRPTVEPTPLLGAVVLPSGHKPPDASGEAQPNFDEIPAHLRGLVQSVTPLPIPTPGPGQPTRIVIPALGVDSTVVVGTDWESLKKGVGQHPGTASPGDRGNLVLAAHNDVYGEIFRDLDQLEPGDEIIVYSIDQPYRYVVTETRIVEPTDVDVMEATSAPTVTLISCYPYRVDNKRIVVFGSLES